MAKTMTGYATQKTHLQKIVENGRVAHLLLFIGSKATLRPIALDFAHQWLKKMSGDFLMQYPHDVHLVKVEGKIGMHSVDSIRDMLEKASLAPFQAKGKVFVVEDAERMLAQSSNALLKTMEEPPANTFFILLTEGPEKLLPTIRSRCQVLHFEQKKTVRGPYYNQLQKLLGKEKLTLCEVTDFCNEVHKNFEEKRKEIEAEFNGVTLGVSKEMLKEMNAQQRQKYEQEMEGACVTKWMQEVTTLFCDIGFVYREASLQNIQGKGVRNAGFQLEKVQKGLMQAKLALERSTPLKNALQTFFLRLTI